MGSGLGFGVSFSVFWVAGFGVPFHAPPPPPPHPTPPRPAPPPPPPPPPRHAPPHPLLSPPSPKNSKPGRLPPKQLAEFFKVQNFGLGGFELWALRGSGRRSGNAPLCVRQGGSPCFSKGAGAQGRRPGKHHGTFAASGALPDRAGIGDARAPSQAFQSRKRRPYR